jgi:hypothetical protein
LSITLPSVVRLSLVLTKAGPLPGFTCWNSTILKIVPSTSMCVPFLNWLVEIMLLGEASDGLSATLPWEDRAAADQGDLMDQTGMERLAAEHGRKVVRGDMDGVMADIAEELRAKGTGVSDRMPRPTTEANVLSVDVRGAQAICEIRYSGADKSVTLRSRWEERDGKPVIVELAATD